MGIRALTKGQIGVESTPGTSVAATRQLVGLLKLEDDRVRERRAEERGSASDSTVVNDLAYRAKGKYSGRATTMELPYWLATSIRGDVSPTQPDSVNAPSVRLWTFGMPLTTFPDLKTLTGYHGDNIQAMKSTGLAVSKLVIKGGDEKPLMVECELIGRRYQTGVFAALTHPTTEDMKSLLTKWYIDATGAGIGGTQITGTFYDWEWSYDSGISPDYTEDGTLDMSGFHRNFPRVSLKATVKWNSAIVNEFSNFDAITKRFIRIENEGSTIATTFKHRLRLDGAYHFTKFTVLDGDKNGTNICKLEAEAMEDATWAKTAEVTVQNTLAAL